MPDVELVDVEAFVIPFLNARNAESPAATKVPAARPKRFTRAWRTGGAAENRVLDVPVITVSCAAPDAVTAAADAATARHALLNEYTAMPLVRSVSVFSGPYYDPDPDTNEDRYTFAVRLRVRGARR